MDRRNYFNKNRIVYIIHNTVLPPPEYSRIISTIQCWHQQNTAGSSVQYSADTNRIQQDHQYTTELTHTEYSRIINTLQSWHIQNTAGSSVQYSTDTSGGLQHITMGESVQDDRLVDSIIIIGEHQYNTAETINTILWRAWDVNTIHWRHHCNKGKMAIQHSRDINTIQQKAEISMQYGRDIYKMQKGHQQNTGETSVQNCRDPKTIQ